jgi:hypothetical protein
MTTELISCIESSENYFSIKIDNLLEKEKITTRIKKLGNKLKCMSKKRQLLLFTL